MPRKAEWTAEKIAKVSRQWIIVVITLVSTTAAVMLHAQSAMQDAVKESKTYTDQRMEDQDRRLESIAEDVREIRNAVLKGR